MSSSTPGMLGSAAPQFCQADDPASCSYHDPRRVCHCENADNPSRPVGGVVAGDPDTPGIDPLVDHKGARPSKDALTMVGIVMEDIRAGDRAQLRLDLKTGEMQIWLHYNR